MSANKAASNIDLAVLLIFFARPNTLCETFQMVKQARPSKLFLACDGPRDNVATEAERVAACQKIVEDIDWECEVYHRYSEQNLGCGRGPESAISWAFEYVDKLVILEDDCVANPTFFPYMKELLDRYETDSRVGIISGFNHFKEWDSGENSYFFTKSGATLGWGTWKRVWQQYDYYVNNIKDPYCKRLLEREFFDSSQARDRIRSWELAAKETRERKVNYWDIQFGFVKYVQSYLCVVPKYNLIYNNGVGVGSTHTEANRAPKWKPGQVLFMPTRPLEFPLKHPQYVICDRKYDTDCYNKILKRTLFKRVIKKLKRVFFK